MYSYSALGRNGRLGNQMFQYAALFSIAKLNNEEYYIPEGDYDLLKCFPNISAKFIDENARKTIGRVFSLKESVDFTFDQNALNARDNSDLRGYFQSELYFSHCKEDLKKEFSFDEDTLRTSKNKLTNISGNNKVCAVHFRRGDYLNLPDYHTNLGSDYYNKSINWMLNNFDCKILVFSDDIEWCKKNLPNDLFSFSDGESMFEDLCMMSLCDYHIIANSSFSWWGAWLADSKQVIAPKQWFGPKGPKKWDTIYCNGWGLI